MNALLFRNSSWSGTHALPEISKRIPGLDLPRCAAITLVLAAHHCGPLQDLGYFGVELFFALSGYLIGGILIRIFSESGRPDLAGVLNFWQRRWWRTLPNYLFFLLLMFAFHSFQDGIGSVPRGFEALSYLVFCQNMVQTGQFFFGVAWSLCVEEWFYLLFPLLALLLTKLKLPPPRALLVVLVLFPAGCAVLRTYFLLNGYKMVSVRMLTLGRLDAIGYGVLLVAFVRFFKPSTRGRWWLALTGLLLLSASVPIHLQIRHGVLTANLSLILPSLGFACLLPWCEKLTMLKSPEFLRKTIQNLSLWSYSIYLCHIPILYLVYDAAGNSRSMPWVNITCRFVALAISISFSAFIYRVFESKMTLLRPRELVRAKPALC